MSKRIKKCVYYDYMLCKTFLHTLVFKDASSPLFLTYCRIDIFRVLRQSFCGKFQIVCGFWNPANPAFRMYANHIEVICAQIGLFCISARIGRFCIFAHIGRFCIFAHIGRFSIFAHICDGGRWVSQ